MQEEWVGVATAQAGAITSEQLARAGVTVGRRRALVRAGVLDKVQRGVYRLVGSEPDWRRALWIALLASGEAAFACRRSAATLWELDGVEHGCIDIAVPAGAHPRRPGSLECALRRKLVSLGSLSGSAESARSPGAARLRRVLDQRPEGAPPTESDPETRFMQIARRMGLPEPRRQYVVILRGRKYRLDFAWPGMRMAVEIDSISAHGPDRLDADLHRQNQIQLDGWLIVRFTRQKVVHDPRGVERDLRAAWELRTIASWR
jgi:very-short-patch-repair endonuclease